MRRTHQRPIPIVYMANVFYTAAIFLSSACTSVMGIQPYRNVTNGGETEGGRSSKKSESPGMLRFVRISPHCLVWLPRAGRYREKKGSKQRSPKIVTTNRQGQPTTDKPTSIFR